MVPTLTPFISIDPPQPQLAGRLATYPFSCSTLPAVMVQFLMYVLGALTEGQKLEPQ